MEIVVHIINNSHSYCTALSVAVHLFVGWLSYHDYYMGHRCSKQKLFETG